MLLYIESFRRDPDLVNNEKVPTVESWWTLRSASSLSSTAVKKINDSVSQFYDPF